VHVVRVAHHADRGPALRAHAAHLAGRQRHLRPRAFAGGEGGAGPGAAAQLAAAAGLHFQVVHRHAQRDAPQRQAVADARLGVRAAHDPVARLQPLRRQDVGLGAVLVLEQGDARRAVRVVLDGDDVGPDAVLVALEVDEAVLALVPAAAETGAGHALEVAPALLR